MFSSKLTKLCYATYRGGSDRDMLEGLTFSGDGAVLATPAGPLSECRLLGELIGSVTTEAFFAIYDTAH